MRQRKLIVPFLALLCLLAGCGSENLSEEPSMESSTSAVTEESQMPASDTESTDNKTEQTEITIQIEDVVLTGELNNSALADEFITLLPQTISMQRVGGGREFYGNLNDSLNYDETDAQTTFENGDIAYWFSGNGLCLLYDNQVAEPEIESGIIVIGKITSDFSELHNLSDNVTVTVSLAE